MTLAEQFRQNRDALRTVWHPAIREHLLAERARIDRESMIYTVEEWRNLCAERRTA